MTSSPSGAPARRGSRARVRQIAGGCVAVLACAATAAATLPATAAAAPGPAAAGERPTGYGLGASAYGSRVTPGALQTGSARSALVVVGCTTDSGIDRAKGVQSDDLEGNGTASGIRTRVWTTERDGVVSSSARSRIDNVALGNEVGALRLTNLTVVTRAWHDRRGFHRENSFDLGGFEGVAGTAPLPVLPDPDDIQPGQQYDVPGLATLTFDVRTGRATRAGATTSSTGLLIEFVDGSDVYLAGASAKIDGAAGAGILRGTAQSAYSQGDLVEAQNVVKKSVPCNGTQGRWRTASGEATEQPGIRTSQATVGAFGEQSGTRFVARTRAHTSRVALAGQAVVVTNIRSQANVVRDGRSYTRTPTGSDIGKLLVNGEPQAVPAPGRSTTVAGVAVITRQVVTRGAQSITVVGLRIRMLPATGAPGVYDIARSYARVLG